MLLDNLRRNNGLKSLLEVCGIKGNKVNPGDVGFKIGPRINAAGRLGKAELSVKLFFSESVEESKKLALRLDSLNAERQGVEKKTLKQAMHLIEAKSLHERYKLLILGCEGWHRGVIGIVASRLKEYFNRPEYLEMIEKKFGIEIVNHINKMLKYGIKRKYI